MNQIKFNVSKSKRVAKEANHEIGEFTKKELEKEYADLCKDCGSVRIYVKETDRDWS